MLACIIVSVVLASLAIVALTAYVEGGSVDSKVALYDLTVALAPYARTVASLAAYTIAILTVALLVGCYPLPDPSESFEQGDCNGVSWYRDPGTMAHKLDCSLAHYR